METNNGQEACRSCLATAGKMRGRHRLFDPLVESGYATEQVEKLCRSA